MKTNLKTWIFVLLISFSLSFDATNDLASIEKEPMYKVVLSQISMMTKEKVNKKAGFNRIQSLLNELIDNTHYYIQSLEHQQTKHKSYCAIQTKKFSIDISSLKATKAKFVKNLKNLKRPVKLLEKIRVLKIKLNRLKKLKYVYQKTHELVKAKVLSLRKSSKKVYNNIDCVVRNYQDLLTNSLVPKKGAVSGPLLRLLKSNLEVCYKGFKTIVSTKIALYDDTADCEYKKKLTKYLTLSNPYKKNLNYIKAVNGSRNLLITVKRLVAYYNRKLSSYTNYSKKVFSYNSTIAQLRKLIHNYENYHLRFYINVRRSLKSSIKRVERSRSALSSAKKAFIKDCKNQGVALELKYSNTLTQLESYKKLKEFFKSNYSKIAKSMKVKYN